MINNNTCSNLQGSRNTDKNLKLANCRGKIPMTIVNICEGKGILMHSRGKFENMYPNFKCVYSLTKQLPLLAIYPKEQYGKVLF